MLMIIFCALRTSLVTAMAPPPLASLLATPTIGFPMVRASLSSDTCFSADNDIVMTTNIKLQDH